MSDAAQAFAMSTISSPPLLHHPVDVTRATREPGDRAILLRHLALFCGLLSSLVNVLANVLGAMIWDGYSSASQTISELSAIGAPSRSVVVPLGITYDVLLVAFAVGAWQCAGEKRGLRVAAGMLFAIGAIGFFWPPMHLRGTVATLTDTLHVVWAAVVSLLILLSIGFGANALGKRFRSYSIATLATLLVVGGVTFAYAPRLAANLPTPWLGVVERIDVGGYLLWVAVLAIGLLRATRRGTRAAGASP
jgi:uncharacterized protein DUF998